MLWLFLFSAKEVQAWGFYAHERIHKNAVFYQPPELYGFYKEHLDYLVENSVAADKRRYVEEEEGRKHYIDIDVYGEYPFDSLPREWDAAMAKFGKDTLHEYGTLPWSVEELFAELTEAFRSQNEAQILRLSADIGHYVSDANSPLHTTLNYNGQLTGQEGIHSLWESRLPELFAEDYDLLVDEPYYVEDPLDAMFDIILTSHQSVDSILTIEREVREEFQHDALYTYEERGQQRMRMPSVPFCREYHEAMNGMVERYFRKSIRDVASFWYSAWVKGGKPELHASPDLSEELPDISPENEISDPQPDDFKGRPDK